LERLRVRQVLLNISRTGEIELRNNIIDCEGHAVRFDTVRPEFGKIP